MKNQSLNKSTKKVTKKVPKKGTKKAGKKFKQFSLQILTKVKPCDEGFLSAMLFLKKKERVHVPEGIRHEFWNAVDGLKYDHGIDYYSQQSRMINARDRVERLSRQVRIDIDPQLLLKTFKENSALGANFRSYAFEILNGKGRNHLRKLLKSDEKAKKLFESENEDVGSIQYEIDDAERHLSQLKLELKAAQKSAGRFSDDDIINMLEAENARFTPVIAPKLVTTLQKIGV